MFSKFAYGKSSLNGGTTKSFRQRMRHRQRNVWPGTLSIICWRYYLVKIIHFRDKKITLLKKSCIDSYITYYKFQEDKSDILHMST